MAELFDVPVTEDSVNKKTDKQNNSSETDEQTFEQKSNDLNLIIDKEEVKEEKSTDAEVIQAAANKISKKIIHPSKKKDQFEFYEQNGNNQVKKENIEESSETEITKDENILDEAEHDFLFEEHSENPLNLDSQDLCHYRTITDKYKGQFILYDGNPVMKSFYRYKTQELGFLISQFGVMNCSAFRTEIVNIHADSSISGIPHGEIITKKMNQVQRQRERLSEILTLFHQQYPVWEKALEMLKGKLWCVKDIKGQHKREGIVADHMNEVVHYVSELKAVLDSGKHVDDILKASHDSLSRQLSCILDMRKREVSDPMDREFASRKNISHTSSMDEDEKDEELERLDVIEEGLEISCPSSVFKKRKTMVGEIDFGLGKDKSDDVSEIG